MDKRKAYNRATIIGLIWLAIMLIVTFCPLWAYSVKIGGLVWVAWGMWFMNIGIIVVTLWYTKVVEKIEKS